MESREYLLLVDLINARFGGVDTRLEGIDTRLGGIDTRLGRVEATLEAHERTFAEIAVRVDVLDRRVEALADALAEHRREMLQHFDEIYRRIERLEQEYQAVVEALRRIEIRLDTEARRREALEGGLAELGRQLGLLQGRVDRLEERLRG